MSKGLVIGTTPPEDTKALFFNTSNHTLNFFDPQTGEWKKCRGAYADANMEVTPQKEG